ncbi:Altered inheritance of mitochondria protein 24, mitochondrial [Exophiala xenobiotica]|nr:Altered inheritance of mitochondria protein 24, mitochondrial [Exophiala xenobiotica]
MPLVAARNLRQLSSLLQRRVFPAHLIAGRRVGGYKYISVQATPATDTSRIDVAGESISASSPDATFEVLGSPYSFLSVTLSPSQDLYTRRGTLAGFAGGPDGTVSTLRLLKPIRRALVGIPFLYQKITSTSPANALISTKSPYTTFAILQLDDTTDWKLAQRKALLAWTGSTLSVKPSLNARLSLACWGSSDVTGRGLLALAGSGQVYAIELARGETYVVHPANVLAYSASSPSPLPQPYRCKSNNIRLQIPLHLGNWFPPSKFIETLKTSQTYQFIANSLLRIRTWSRRTIREDRLILQLQWPTTLLVQSCAVRVIETLTAQEVNEIADSPAGTITEAIDNVQCHSSVSTSGPAVRGTTVHGNWNSAKTLHCPRRRGWESII